MYDHDAANRCLHFNFYSHTKDSMGGTTDAQYNVNIIIKADKVSD